MLGANNKTKRKLPKHAQIYAYGSQDCRNHPLRGDLYEFENLKILVSDVKEKENIVTFYKNGVRKTINDWEFRDMIVTIPGKYTFSCYPNE